MIARLEILVFLTFTKALYYHKIILMISKSSKTNIFNQMKIISSLLFILLFNLNIYAHPIKLTTSKLQYYPTTGLIELTVNFFLDDLIPVLKKQYKIPALNIEQNKILAKKIISDYTDNKLHIWINDKEYNLELKDISPIQTNVLQAKFMFTLKPLNKIGKLEVINQLLFEAYEDQVNILHVFVPNQENIILKFMPFDFKQKISF